jgi:hypothetical protein
MRSHHKCDCNVCMLMNAKKAPFKEEAEHRSTVPGERIHSDVKELSVRSRQGHKYAVCFVDDATRRGKSYSMSKKSEVLSKWRLFLEQEVLSKSYKCKYFRSDNGGEFISDELIAFNNVRGIQAEYSPPHCQSGNGVAEVYWRETFKLVRAILWDQQREDEWWTAALQFANYIRNHIMTYSVDDRPPECAWQDKIIDLSHWRVPLSKCWAFVEKTNRDGTLDKRRLEVVFVGYAPRSHSYLVYDPIGHEIYSRRYADVEFDERCQATASDFIDVAVADTLLAQLELQAQQANNPGGEGAQTPKPAHPGFMRVNKPWSVDQLAKLFNISTEEYLQVLHQHPGWYQALTKGSSKVQAISDVPIPYYEQTPTVTTTQPSTGSRRARKKRKVNLTCKINGVPREVQMSKGVRTRAQAQTTAQMHGHHTSTPQVALALQAIEQQLRDDTLLAAESLMSSRKNSQKFNDTTEPQVSLAPGSPSEAPTQPPKHYDAARKGAHSAKWTDSEMKEWHGLWNMGAFEDDRACGQKLHHLIWTYKIKSDGTLKSRLVLDGRRQDPGTYDDIRSPTMQLTSFRIMLALAAQN